MRSYRVRVQPGLATLWVDEEGHPSRCLLETPESYATELEGMAYHMNQMAQRVEVEHD